jgi:hypothetical protein
MNKNKKNKKPDPFDNVITHYKELSPKEDQARLERLSRKIIEAFVSLQLRKKCKTGNNDTLNIERNLEKELDLPA